MLKNKKNGKIYIGQTTRPIKKRFKEHWSGKSDNCRAIYNAIKKHGWDNFEKDWYECPDEDLNFDEDLLMRKMITLSPYGYNLREGGGNRGKHSEETKQKMSEVHLGKTHTEESKRKNSESNRGEKHHMYGKTLSDEHKQKISESHLGKTHTNETKRKMSQAKIGLPKSDEHKKKISEAQTGEKNHASKRIYQYDLDGTFINSFGSSEEAGRHLEKDGTSIRSCARGKYKTAYSFKWSYKPLGDFY